MRGAFTLIEPKHDTARRSATDQPRVRGAFTLIELLVAMTVTAVLTVLLAQIFSSSLSIRQRSEAKVDAYREARAALQIMGRDLSQTIQPTVTPAALATPSASATLPTLVIARSSESTPAANYAFESVYCLTALPNNGGSSDLCAVGYYCQWDSSKHAFVLMRQFTDSDKNFANLTAAASSQPLDFLALYSSKKSTVSSDLASYVWDLEVRIDSSLIPPPTEPPTPPASNFSPGRVYGTSPPYPDYLPPFVEIRFKAVSSMAIRNLAGNPAITAAVWQNPADPSYQKFILPSAQQFSLRVPLHNHDSGL